MVDSLGQVVSRRDFMPFGEEITPDGTHRTANLKYNFGDNIRQKFTGYQKDEETQLDFAEARMYENRLGRFTAIDPLLDSAKSAKPQSFNRFVYCYNNPLRYVDRDGQIPVETVIDVVSFAHSFWSLMRDPSLANVGFLVWDVAAVVIPYAPGSWAGRAAKSVLSGGAKVSREAAEWTSKVARDGYRGLRAQGIVGRGLATNLEKFLNNDYIKKGYALLSQGDDSTRRLLGMSASTKAADFVGVSKSGTFVVGEAKGYREIATGVEQLKNTMQALYNSVSRQGSGFKASAEIVIEGTAKEFLEKNILEYTLSGNQLMRQVGEKLVAETIQVVDAAGRRVAQIPVTVRFVQ